MSVCMRYSSANSTVRSSWNRIRARVTGECGECTPARPSQRDRPIALTKWPTRLSRLLHSLRRARSRIYKNTCMYVPTATRAGLNNFPCFNGLFFYERKRTRFLNILSIQVNNSCLNGIFLRTLIKCGNTKLKYVFITKLFEQNNHVQALF